MYISSGAVFFKDILRDDTVWRVIVRLSKRLEERRQEVVGVMNMIKEISGGAGGGVVEGGTTVERLPHWKGIS
jgi:hypothetical protein